jgi:hypothetical protein
MCITLETNVASKEKKEMNSIWQFTSTRNDDKCDICGTYKQKNEGVLQ